MVSMSESKRTVTNLILIIISLIILWLTFSATPAFAEIGDCHSYVYWRLTNKELVYVPYEKLATLLEKKLYRYREISSSLAPPVRIMKGDVVTFGTSHGHSGIALNDMCISHMRGTQNQHVDPRDNSLYPGSGYYKIPIWWLNAGKYCDDIRYNEIANRWRSQGASKESIKQKFKEGRTGFYEPCSTIADIYKRLPNLKGLPVKIWSQPTLLGIDPTEATIFEDEFVHFTPMLYYSHLDKWRVAEPDEINYSPTYVQNGEGTVLGSDAGVGTHEIYVDAPDVPIQKAIAKLVVKERKRSGVAPCGGIVGTWHWFNGATVYCTYGKNRKSGTCTASNGFNGTWECTYPTGGLFEIIWTKGTSKFVDTLNLVNDGKGLWGTNQSGGSVSATRK